jgi:hypothetical protein
MENFMQKSTEEKLKYIFSEIEQGADRGALSRNLGYKSYKTMDMFVRRQGYTWDGRLGRYLLPQERNSGRYAKIILGAGEKVEKVLNLFEKKELDAKEISLKVGFSSHRELAVYMKSKGYIWDSDLGNYCLGKGAATEIKKSETKILEEDVDVIEENLQEEDQELSEFFLEDRYKNLLEYLLKKKDLLNKILDEQDIGDSEGIIPRYVLPGIFITKSVHMTNCLGQLVKDFSDEKNISQREIFEVALVEFFQRYGYKNEVQTLMEQK